MNENKTKKIKPELSRGLKDYLPNEMAARQKIIDNIREVFESFGFSQIDTPAIEKKDILTGGDAGFSKQIFEIQKKEGDSDLALRFDLTVPLARVVSSYPQELKKPFKRYQVGKVWRGERPQAGRFREFTQFDADIVGAPSVLADAEIIYLINATLTKLGIENFLIKINNRKILGGLPKIVGFPKEKIGEVLKTLDKIDRDGWPKVEKILLGELEDEETKLNLSKKQTELIKDFIDASESEVNIISAKTKKILAQSESASEGITELEEIIRYLKAFGVSENKWKIDFSVARGLGYYTGPVFEAVLTDLPQIGSVFSGGRYDDLVSRFGSSSIPATGASVGVDRLFVATEKLGLIGKENLSAGAIVLNFDPECAEYAAKITATLRSGGAPANIYLGQEKTLKGQLSYAISEGYKFVVIAGGEEMENNSVQLKNTSDRSQKAVKLSDLVSEIKS